MTSIWGNLTLAGALLAVPSVVVGQRVHELGVQLIATTDDPVAVVAGPSAGIRVERRVRLVGTAALGVQGGDVAWRLEGLAHFHLHPNSHSLGVYGGGGLALAGGVTTQGYMVVLLGIEESPGGGGGWTAELGFGGGFRMAVGYRWR
jgi:hypothetical protein